MNRRVHSRRLDEARLAALVDDALDPSELEQHAYVGDWPLPPGSASAGLTTEIWDRALGDVARDILSRPSRQFRGRLAELSFRMAGATRQPPPCLGGIVEVIHAGSLIVDDIQDRSTERRGAACVHLNHGLGRALNGANWMYFWALQMVERLEPDTPLVRDRLYRALIDAMARCHLGQSLDLSLAVWRLPRADVNRVVATGTMLKTGALMELAARLGAVVGGAPAEREEALTRFGRRLGVGLQMLDDFGNLTAGSDGNAAKAREDLRNGTPTWPWALAAEGLDAPEFAALQAAAREVADSGDAEGAAARDLAARLRAAVGFEGRRRAARYLEQSLADLRRAVDDCPEIALVAAEIRRLEVSYG
jgi:geranylgeranyl pyrophosphate synthase